MRITSLKNCLSTFIFFRVSFWALFLCISIESRTKLKKIWTKQTKQSGEEVRKLRYLSKWTAKKNEHGEGVMLIRTFVVKAIDNERKKLTHHKIFDCIAEQLRRWSFQWAKNQNWGFIRTYRSHISQLLIHLNPLINVL